MARPTAARPLEDGDARVAEDELLADAAPACRAHRRWGQAPKGELKEKWTRLELGMEMPHTGQPYFSEKVSTVPVSALNTSTSPSASLSAVSTSR
jgi:hypothetical protein